MLWSGSSGLQLIKREGRGFVAVLWKLQLKHFTRHVLQLMANQTANSSIFYFV